MWSDASDRYKTPISDIFSAENKIKLQVRIEVILAKTQAELGVIEQTEADKIEMGGPKVKATRVQEIEKEIEHDVMALVQALAEQSGTAGEKVHLGATSSDIQDTVLALQMIEARTLIVNQIDLLLESLSEKARKTRDLVCIGRTHGQFAVPTTVGFKFANFMYELNLATQPLRDAPISLAKFSGAVGNYASTMILDIEELVLKKLGLQPVLISTQVVSRTVHAQFMSALAIIAGVLERISKEIRNLQRSEINEWLEPFGKTQVGSSAMPHKRNPHKSERISGLARIVRANVVVAMENIALEHERDISHSSVERIILPESANLLYFMLNGLNNIIKTLTINENSIKKNLNEAWKNSKSEQILMKLSRTIGRQRGHELLRSHITTEGIENTLLEDPEILKHISKTELGEIITTINPGLAAEKVNQILAQYEAGW